MVELPQKPIESVFPNVLVVLCGRAQLHHGGAGLAFALAPALPYLRGRLRLVTGRGRGLHVAVTLRLVTRGGGRGLSDDRGRLGSLARLALGHLGRLGRLGRGLTLVSQGLVSHGLPRRDPLVTLGGEADAVHGMPVVISRQVIAPGQPVRDEAPHAVQLRGTAGHDDLRAGGAAVTQVHGVGQGLLAGAQPQQVNRGQLRRRGLGAHGGAPALEQLGILPQVADIRMRGVGGGVHGSSLSSNVTACRGG